MSDLDAVVVGSGPNGLAAAVTLAAAGLRVSVIEGAPTVGGGCRTEELTLPGYRHDVCSAVHPMMLASPFFRQPCFDGLRATVRQPEVPFAHPLDGGRAGAAFRSLDDTVVALGADGPAYRRLIGPLVAAAEPLSDAVLSPLRACPRHPVTLARFGLPGLLPISRLVRRFATPEAAALLAGVAAHSMAPLDRPMTSALGTFLATTAHSVGWPVVAGGSQGITDALVAELIRLGGTVATGEWVTSLAELPPATAVVVDTSPRGLLALAGEAFPDRYGRALRRYRYGPGICKVDLALSGPVPWMAEVCRQAGTLHLGGTFAEVAASEADVNAGRHPERPYCLAVQPGVVDPSRAPTGHQTLWLYCHVPSGSTRDMSAAMEAQVERFAPGFGDLVLARSVRTAEEVERHNPNYVGGDIAGGAATLAQTAFRPTVAWNPYRTSLPNVYLGSASAAPGAGVHGMCGVYAARTILHDHFGGSSPLTVDRGVPVSRRRPRHKSAQIASPTGFLPAQDTPCF
jgi:phytoene dehydrogenase-like protein